MKNITALKVILKLSLIFPTSFLVFQFPAMAAEAQSLPDGYDLDEYGSALVHRESGFAFPAEMSGFKRTNSHEKDFSGDYVQIGYDRKIGDDIIAVRIAVVHLADLTAKDHYEIMKPIAMSYFSSTSVVSEGDYPIFKKSGIPAYQGIFSGLQENKPWHFSLTTIDYGYWDARLVAAYPEKIDAKAQKAIHDLVAAFQWQRPSPPGEK